MRGLVGGWYHGRWWRCWRLILKGRVGMTRMTRWGSTQWRYSIFFSLCQHQANPRYIVLDTTKIFMQLIAVSEAQACRILLMLASTSPSTCAPLRIVSCYTTMIVDTNKPLSFHLPSRTVNGQSWSQVPIPIVARYQNISGQSVHPKIRVASDLNIRSGIPLY